jgi:hypothetical protein
MNWKECSRKQNWNILSTAAIITEIGKGGCERNGRNLRICNFETDY